MNIHIILISALCANLIPAIPIKAETTQLAARPIVFIDICKAFSHPTETSGSLEFRDLLKRINDLSKVCSPGQPNEECTKLQKDVLELRKKLVIIAGDIAKRLGACAVIPTGFLRDDYVDMCHYHALAYDITCEAIEQLNKEYLATCKAINTAQKEC